MRDIMQWDKKNDFLNLKKTLPILYYLNSKNDNFILIKNSLIRRYNITN